MDNFEILENLVDNLGNSWINVRGQSLFTDNCPRKSQDSKIFQETIFLLIRRKFTKTIINRSCEVQFLLFKKIFLKNLVLGIQFIETY